MKKAVVTGGLGFIGFHLCQSLLEKGIEVVCVDVYSEERKAEQDEKRMWMGRHALFHYLAIDLDDQIQELNEHLGSADMVFHLASPVTKDSKWQTKHQTIHQAEKWVRTLCKGMKTEGTFILPSTVEVYGDIPGLITEETPLQPASPYGLIKLEVEQSVKKEAEANGITYQIVRMPTVYGPWQRSDMTFNQLISQQSDVYQDRSTVDLLYVSDAVKGLILAANSSNHSDIYHLSSGEEGQWFKAAKQLGADSEVLKRTHAKSTLSSEKAHEHLGFLADVRIEEGLKQQKEHHVYWKKVSDT